MAEYATVIGIDTEIVEEKPPLLHNTNTLEVEANRLLGLTAAETQKCLQNLYEAGFITYPRTSSHYITPDMAQSVAELASGTDSTAHSSTTLTGAEGDGSGNAIQHSGAGGDSPGKTALQASGVGGSGNLDQQAYLQQNTLSNAVAVEESEKTEPKSIEGSNTYSLLPGEGNIGTYKELVKAGRRGDNITPHHMPSAEYMKAKGIAKKDGLCMNMEMHSPGKGGRHRSTDTYGRNMNDEQKKSYYSLSPRDALAHDLKNVRAIYKSQGLWPEIRPKILEYIKKSKELMPNLFEKRRR